MIMATGLPLCSAHFRNLSPNVPVRAERIDDLLPAAPAAAARHRIGAEVSVGHLLHAVQIAQPGARIGNSGSE